MKDFDAMITTGREFMRFCEDDDYTSDQDKKLPQPPLVKAGVSDVHFKLPTDFKLLSLDNDILSVLANRESHRVYTETPMTLLQLSYLLWATQGVKTLRGKKYATLRTVPSGGARHAFETYLAVLNVEGLEPGAYHYLPMTHELELLHPIDAIRDVVGASLCYQNWAASAGVVFYWSMVAYRAEWRYGIYAHRLALIDAGHVCENLYIAASSLSLGTCAIGALNGELSSKMFDLDDDEEFVFYAAPVGNIAPSNRDKELAFYSFVDEEGL